MKLASFGCSFIFGTDLPDDGITGRWHVPSRMTWPALLAAHLGMEYDCRARPGSGNLQIAETVINHLAASPADVYVIGWTWIDRFDYVDDTADDWPATPTSWNTLLPGHNDQVSEFYYRNLHTEHRDKLVSLMSIKNVIDMLIEHDKKFIMTNLDDLVFDRRFHTSPGMTLMQDHCQKFMSDFDGHDFLTYSKSRGFDISENLHPLAQAHQAAAELMITNIDAILHRA